MDSDMTEGIDPPEIAPELLKKLLSLGCGGPLKDVLDITIPEPWPSLSQDSRKQKGSKRGPKPPELWVSEIKNGWDNIEEVDKLGRSWLAFLPEVQEIARSKYEGGTIGRGSALKELLTRAVAEARQLDTDEMTHTMLINYPKLNITDITKLCGISRETFSRNYCPKVAIILTRIFRRIISRRPIVYD
jgi:hypothetical protein